MAITHLLKNTLSLYSPTIGTDSVGGESITWTLVGTFKCRIERLTGDRENRVGRQNTEATHRIYCDSDIYDSLAVDQMISIASRNGDRQFDIVDFEDLDPIIDNSRILHVEILAKYREQQKGVP